MNSTVTRYFTHLVHFFLEGGERLIALSECLLKLLELVRIERQLAAKVTLLLAEYLKPLLLVQGLSDEKLPLSQTVLLLLRRRHRLLGQSRLAQLHLQSFLFQ